MEKRRLDMDRNRLIVFSCVLAIGAAFSGAARANVATIGDGNWTSGPLVWDSFATPTAADGKVNVDDGRVVTINSAVPNVDTLYVDRQNADGGHGTGIGGTLNIEDGGSLIVEGTSDWSYVGEGPGTAVLNLSGNGSIHYQSGVGAAHWILHHNDDATGPPATGSGTVNMWDTSSMTVDNNLWIYNGFGSINIHDDASMTATTINWGTGDYVINITENGVLSLDNASYPLSSFEADQGLGRFAPDTVAVEDAGRTLITQIPEPATMTLMGLGALGLIRRKRA
jgi:hypothetical protein